MNLFQIKKLTRFSLRELGIVVFGLVVGLSVAKWLGWTKTAEDERRFANQIRQDRDAYRDRLYEYTMTPTLETFLAPKRSREFLWAVFEPTVETVSIQDNNGVVSFWTPNSHGEMWMTNRVPSFEKDRPKADYLPPVPLTANVIEGRNAMLATRIGVFILPRNQNGWPHPFIYSRQDGVLKTYPPSGTILITAGFVGVFSLGHNEADL